MGVREALSAVPRRVINDQLTSVEERMAGVVELADTLGVTPLMPDAIDSKAADIIGAGQNSIGRLILAGKAVADALPSSTSDIRETTAQIIEKGRQSVNAAREMPQRARDAAEFMLDEAFEDASGLRVVPVGFRRFQREVFTELSDHVASIAGYGKSNSELLNGEVARGLVANLYSRGVVNSSRLTTVSVMVATGSKQEIAVLNEVAASVSSALEAYGVPHTQNREPLYVSRDPNVAHKALALTLDQTKVGPWKDLIARGCPQSHLLLAEDEAIEAFGGRPPEAEGGVVNALHQEGRRTRWEDISPHTSDPALEPVPMLVGAGPATNQVNGRSPSSSELTH